MTENFTLERARNTHAAAIAQLVNLAYRGVDGWTTEAHIVSGDRISPTQVDALITRAESEVLIQCSGNEVIACLHLQHTAGHCYLGLFAVHPSLQGQGLGRSFLQTAESYALRKYSPEKLLMLVVSQRTELIAYYERCGYRLTEERLPYPVDDNVGTPVVENLSIAIMEKIPPERFNIS